MEFVLPAVEPVVTLSASLTRVGLGQATTLTCTVVRANPTNYTYSWSHGGAVIPGEESTTLSLSSFNSTNAGNYTCQVTNEVGMGLDSIRIELGCELSWYSGYTRYHAIIFFSSSCSRSER